MDNQDFLKTVTASFKKFLETGSRSNEKLKILHGAIAKDLNERLGTGYTINSLGYGKGKEHDIQGRYIDKMVDITVIKEGKPVAGIAVKFVMQNYSQNSNNYFENMLGETANIRSCNIPYFQIFIIPDQIPYYDKEGKIKNWEEFTDHNAEKYHILSSDNPATFMHTPTKTLLYVIHLPDLKEKVNNRTEYINGYQRMEEESMMVCESEHVRESNTNTVIYNDYDLFIQKVTHNILSI